MYTPQEKFFMFSLIAWMPLAILSGVLFNDVNVGGVLGLALFLISSIILIGTGWDECNEHSDL